MCICKLHSIKAFLQKHAPNFKWGGGLGGGVHLKALCLYGGQARLFPKVNDLIVNPITSPLVGQASMPPWLTDLYSGWGGVGGGCLHTHTLH